MKAGRGMVVAKKEGRNRSPGSVVVGCAAAATLPLRFRSATAGPASSTSAAHWAGSQVGAGRATRGSPKLFWFFWFSFSVLVFSLLSVACDGSAPGLLPLFFLYVIYVQSLQSHMLGAPTALRSRRNWRPATSTSRCRFLSLFSLFL